MNRYVRLAGVEVEAPTDGLKILTEDQIMGRSHLVQNYGGLMKLILLPLTIFFGVCAFATPNNPECKEPGRIHPKTRAECFFNEVVESKQSAEVNGLAKELERAGFKTGKPGQPIELASVFISGHCDELGNFDLNCTWTYMVTREFLKHPGDIGTFSDSKSVIGLVEATHDMSVSPKLVKVYSSDELIK